jgi:hypothetical protein
MTPDRATAAAELADVLVGHLLASPAHHWPGADGLLVAEVLRDYPAAAAAWRVPGEIELCGEHPDLTAQVVAFFFLNPGPVPPAADP